MNAFAAIFVFVALFGSLNARDVRLSEDCLSGSRSARDCCATVPRAFYAHLQHPTNCEQFYHCDHGLPVLKDCPSGLHWSVRMDRCEWPSIANCKGSSASSTTTVPTTTPAATTRPTTTTPSGSSTCGTATISNDCRYGKASAENCCVGVKYWQDALLPNAANCGTYIQCVHQKPMIRPCPDGLHWSSDACRCEWPSIAKCTGTIPDPTTTTATKPTTTTTEPTTTTTTKPTTTVSTTTASGTSACSTASISNDCRYGKASAENCCVGVQYWEDALLPNAANCGTYIQCVHGKPMVRPCPDGLHWSADACRCEWPSIAKCTGTIPDPTTTTTTKPTTTTEPTTITTEPTTTTTTKPTTTVSTTTASGTSACSTASISNDCRYGKASAENCCVGVQYWEDALLPNAANCGTYIQCVHEKPMVRPCPDGLHWSPDVCRCEWPSIAKCNGTIPTTPKPTTTTTTTTAKPITTTTEPTTTISSGTGQCGTKDISDECRYGLKSADECCLGVSYLEDVLLPNPENCNTYLQCVYKKPMVRICPDDLHWNPVGCYCDWPTLGHCRTPY